MSLTLVPDGKLDKDPRNLPYLFPSMPVGRYKQATEEYYHLISLKAVEQAAKINDQLVIPATCFHWQRKKELKERNIRMFRNSYYILSIDELSETEYQKYIERVKAYD